MHDHEISLLYEEPAQRSTMEFSKVFFNHPGFIRFSSCPSEADICSMKESAISRFIILDSERSDFVSVDGLFLHERDFLDDNLSHLTPLEYTLLGLLGDQPIFSLVYDKAELSHYPLVPIYELNYHEIDRLSEIALCAFIYSKFHENTKYCSRCGIELIYADRAKTNLRCTACNREIYPTISPCVIFTICADHKLLLGLRYRETFTNFSGFIDVAECADQTVVREFIEETGIDKQFIKNIKAHHYDEPWGNEYGEESYMLSYEIELTSVQPVAPTEEIKEFKWVSFEEWSEAARRTDGITFQGEREVWEIPKIGTVARWMMEKAWEAMGLWK